MYAGCRRSIHLRSKLVEGLMVDITVPEGGVECVESCGVIVNEKVLKHRVLLNIINFYLGIDLNSARRPRGRIDSYSLIHLITGNHNRAAISFRPNLSFKSIV